MKRKSEFFIELADLMARYNATISVERCYDNYYESHAELDFDIDGLFVYGDFYANPLRIINAEYIRQLSEKIN